MVAKDRCKLSIATLSELTKIINESKLYIFDDGSDELELLNFYKKLIGNDSRVNIFLADENNGVEYANINRLEYFNVKDDLYVYLTDNDVEFSSQFEDILNNTYHLLKNTPDVFAATFFNVTPNGCHDIIGQGFTYGNLKYVCKRSFGGISVLLKVSDFVNAMKHYNSLDYNGNFGWDWALCHYGTKVLGKRLIATYESYIQHTGSIGVNSKIDKFDCADNFVK